MQISEQGFYRILNSYDKQDPRKHIDWTTNFTHELPIRGMNDPKPITIPEAFKQDCIKFLNLPALSVKRNKIWQTITYGAYYSAVLDFASALIELNITKLSAVNIVIHLFYLTLLQVLMHLNGILLLWSDLFIHAHNLPVGIYTTNNPEACLYVSEHSECELLVADTREQLDKYLSFWDRLPKLKAVVLYNDTEEGYYFVTLYFKFNILIQIYTMKFSTVMYIILKIFLQIEKYIIGMISYKLEKNLIILMRLIKEPVSCNQEIVVLLSILQEQQVIQKESCFLMTITCLLQLNILRNTKLMMDIEQQVIYLSVMQQHNQQIQLAYLDGVVTCILQILMHYKVLQQTLQKKQGQHFFWVFLEFGRKSIDELNHQILYEEMQKVAKSNGTIKTLIANWAKSLGKVGIANSKQFIVLFLIIHIFFNNQNKIFCLITQNLCGQQSQLVQNQQINLKTEIFTFSKNFLLKITLILKMLILNQIYNYSLNIDIQNLLRKQQKQCLKPQKTFQLNNTFAQTHGQQTPTCFGLAEKIVYLQVKKALGLDKAAYLLFGAAPLSPEIREYFLSLNMFLINAYGMSECGGVQTLSFPENFSQFDSLFMSSAGSAIEGTEMKIFNPDKDGNGEICYKGRHIFMGYFKDDTSTRQTIDENGFLHSGDIGKIDQKGNLIITGRIKELIITAGGENIAPILIENEIKKNLGFVSNCMVIGDNRKYLSVLLTLKQDLSAIGKLSSEVINEFNAQGSQATTVEDAKLDPIIKQYINTLIDKTNQYVISKAQQIRKWTILEGDFSIETGELTPTLKLKRKIVEKKWKGEIERMYLDPKL